VFPAALRLPAPCAQIEALGVPVGAKLGSEWLMIAFVLGKNCREHPAQARFLPGRAMPEFSQMSD
jgi:hypothetical protein